MLVDDSGRVVILDLGLVANLGNDDVPAARADVEAAAARWPDPSRHMRAYRLSFATAQIDSYEGDPEAVLAQLAIAIPALRRALMIRIPEVRLQTRYLRGSAAAAVGKRRRARADARTIESSRMVWARPMARVIRARLARNAGDVESCQSLLRTAAIELDDADMRAYAAATRRRRGEEVTQLCGFAPGPTLALREGVPRSHPLKGNP